MKTAWHWLPLVLVGLAPWTTSAQEIKNQPIPGIGPKGEVRKVAGDFAFTHLDDRPQSAAFRRASADRRNGTGDLELP